MYLTNKKGAEMNATIQEKIKVTQDQISCLEFLIDLLRSNDIRARGYVQDLIRCREIVRELSAKYDSMMNDETVEYIFEKSA